MDPSWVLWHSIGTGTTPSGVISPMSPEWNLGAPRPVTARWNSERAQRPRPGASRLCRSLLPRWIYGKNMMQKHTSLKNIHKNTTFDQHVDQHLKHTSEKLAKPKPSFLQLSSPSCCLLWQLVIARTDGITWPQGSFTKYYPQHSPKLFIAPFPSSCCKQALFNHFSVLSVCVLSFAASSNFQFWCRLSSKFLPDRSRRSHLNAPTKLPRSFISYRDFAETHSDELSINSTFWCTTIQASSERFKQCSKPIIGWFIGIPRSWITDDDEGGDDGDDVNPQFPVESPGKRTLSPGLVCTKVGLAIVVGDLWPGFSINVGMESPTAMKKHRQNIGKMDQNGITVKHIDQWYSGSGIWNISFDTAGNWVWPGNPGIWWIWGARTLSEVSVRRRTGRIQRIQRMDLPAAFVAWQSGGSQAVLPQSPTAVGKPRYVHGKTRRSGHSATAGLCKAWWLMGRICLASSHMQDSSNIEQHTNRSLGNTEIGEL